MGGRGAKSGVGGGAGSGPAGAASVAAGGGAGGAAGNVSFSNTPQRSTVGSIQGVYQSGYDANGNAAVQKFQAQTDDKTANFLGKVAKTQDYPDDGQYDFYEGNYQQFSLALGLNDKATVVSDAQFDQIVKQNNLQVLYRGERNAAVCDRFMNADYSHTGVGSYGDGFYFSQDRTVANDYAQFKGGSNGRVMKMALSPTARCIDYYDLQAKFSQLSPKLQRSLAKAGNSAVSASYKNRGEAQLALKLGYNVVTNAGWGNDYHYALTRDAFIVSDKIKHRY